MKIHWKTHCDCRNLVGTDAFRPLRSCHAICWASREDYFSSGHYHIAVYCGLWVASKIESRFVLHGLLVGTIVSILLRSFEAA